MTEDGATFNGLRVAAFESRRADEMKRFIERFGGTPFVSPSMREAPLGKNAQAVEMANRLLAGEIDTVIFLTGVGVRYFVSQIERHVDKTRFLNSLSDITTVARGPKPVAVLKELGVNVTIRVPEPNTWREVLQTIDEKMSITNQTVLVQEYGVPNSSLVAGLEARGATVLRLKTYEWEFPEDLKPLEENLRAIVAGERDVLMFTSAHQIVNLFRLAEGHDLAETLPQHANQCVIASIGPTTSDMLRDHGLNVDVEPEHFKTGHLVAAAASSASALLAAKRAIAPRYQELVANGGFGHTSENGLFMRACRREPTERTPIWLMRQAGRYMPEYRAVREKTSFLELCKNPKLCAEVMITAVDRLRVDAAIIFSDLLPILEPMGFDLEFTKGDGPQIHNPVRSADDLKRIKELEDVDSLSFVMETVTETRASLSDDIPVIGFAGAPFTLASYAIEGAGSRNYLHAKTLMYRDEPAWNALLGMIARSVTRYLNAQIAAGAQAVQLFDSWVGALGPEDYRRYVLPHVRTIAEGLTPGATLIHFATGNPALLPVLAEAGGHVIGLDWRIPLDEGWKTVGYDRAVQGNLDPAVLLADVPTIRAAAKNILDQAGGRPGHIFNLGHGVHQQTPVENVIALVEAVRELSSKRV